MRIIDLSMELDPSTQVFSAYPSMAVLRWTSHEVQGFAAEVIHLSTHTGTHVDAPYHFNPDGSRIHEVSLSRLVGEAVLIDLGEKPPLSLISAEDLKACFKKVCYESGNIVLIKTSWVKMVGRAEYLTMNPGLSSDAAEYLVEQGAASVGLDAPNLDQAQASDFPAHKILLKSGVPIIENLANLELIKSPKFLFAGAPLRIRGASGSPIRAVAIINNS